MKDKTGVYYYPYANNKQVRMYVRNADNTIEFRLWSSTDPDLWNSHGWIPYEAIQEAIKMYDPSKGGSFDPSYVYDLSIAKSVLKSADNVG